MKNLSKISSMVLLSIVTTACANLKQSNIGSIQGPSNNPLKTVKDTNIEKVLTSGTWKYERQSDDCKDTNWLQNFYANRYYKSVGAACLVPNAFTVDAENWHLKDQILYVTNLSPDSGEDIILRYGIHYLDENRMVLSSGDYKYTFTRE